MMKKVLLLSTFLFILPGLSFAFFCPTNFNQIEYGMTKEQVMQQCGKADNEKEFKKVNDDIPQEWTYFIAQPLATGPTSAFQTQGSLKTTINFDSKGNVVNITVNGLGVGATSICGNRSISIGSSRDTVKNACGAPSFVVKQSPTEDSNTVEETPMTEFYYNSTPPTVLVFENGVLTTKRTTPVR